MSSFSDQVQFLIIYQIMRPQQSFKGFSIILPFLFLVKMLIILQSFTKKAFACEPAEYYIQGNCCPVCSAGSRVYKHCTEDFNTVCVPCVGDTYTDRPDHLLKCWTCQNCDKGLGLMKIQECTPTSDTVCSVLPGYFCKEYSGSSCTTGKKHQSCSPGQFISRKGNAEEDTQCEGCPENTYSNGTLNECKRHTNCKSLGLKEKNRGTHAMDAECTEHSNTVAIVIGVIYLALTLIIGVFIILKRKKLQEGLHNLLRKPQQETNQARVGKFYD
uniref:Tumor necrosis factor receptor superfamily member 14-like n=1 Tax=Erpetoichthys calabaricus TaxID=27687 RepID=A0A8C4T3Z3_ERPCA